MLRKFYGWVLTPILLTPGIALAQDSAAVAKEIAMEEVVVTGSYIRGSAENAALPIDVITSEEMEEVGNPSMIEFIRSLGISSGNLGESNQFNSPGQGQYGVTTINLRGLGSARTLTLINGKRQVATEDNGVDVNAFPMNAWGRTEILKDGAAALYGSDAIAGVVNFISRAGFEGLELTGSQQWIDGSDGNQMLQATYGWANDRMNFLGAFEWDHRSELRIRDKNWGLKDFADNFNGGWSTTGMPGTTYLVDPNLPVPDGALPGTNQQVYAGPDPACEELGGQLLFGTCNFQFTYFDNIIEKSDTYKTYVEGNYDINDATTLHVEGMYAVMDMPNWKSSPSYPPNSLYGPDRIIPDNNPGLIQYKADYPELFTNLPAGETIDTVDVYQRSRYLGVNGRFGKPLSAKFKTKTYRFAVDLKGELPGFNYDAGVTYSKRHRNTNGYDMQVQGMAFALNGYGGPDCTPGGSDPATSTQGQGPCQWFNPFSNGIENSVVAGIANPTFDPALANSEELINWLTLRGNSKFTNELLVWDLVFDGETGIELAGGTVGWAAGIQARREKYDTNLNDVSNAAIEPCPWTNPFAVDLGFTTADQLSPNCDVKFGLVAFGVPADAQSTSRTVYAAFGEVAVPITDTLDMQLAVRYEDYGSDGGQTIDPKLAIRWQALDWLALRGSVSTTFRGAPQSYLGGVDTVLQNIPAASAYRAVNYVGNPDLDPEKAVAANFGLIFETGGLTATADYWYFDFSDPFQLESASQILGAYTANGCQGNGTPQNPFGPGVGTPVCDDDLRPRFVPEGTTVAGLASVDTYYINGSDIKTSGIDFSVDYTFPALDGEFSVGAVGTYTIEYDSDDFKSKNGTFLAEGGDFVGYMNIGQNPFYPLPDLKGFSYLRYNQGPLSLSYTLRYVADYKDNGAANAYLQDVNDNVTHDFTAVYSWRDLTVSASAFNFTDEDPPEVYLPQNYDPYTHSPNGRMYKLQLTYTIGGN